MDHRVTPSLFFGALIITAVSIASSHFFQNTVTVPSAEETQQTDHGEIELIRTFRIRDLPLKIDVQRLQAALEAKDTGVASPQGSPQEGKVVGISVTPPASHNLATSVATVCFRRIPRQFQDQIDRQNEHIYKTVCLRFESESLTMRIDESFHGLTPLFWSTDHAGWDVDIVAVTGLNARPFGSWKAAHSPEMWLRDWIGPDLKQDGFRARVFTYGYPSVVVGSINNSSLSDYGQGLVDALKIVRTPDTKGSHLKPLVLIGHSLGGLVIKQALKDVSMSSDESDMHIFESCACLLMFGVPNLGLNNEALKEMVREQKNEMLIWSLGERSEYLFELEKSFKDAIRDQDITIVAIYETKDSPSNEYKLGKWSRTGDPILMVSRESACSCGSSERVKKVPSQTNHSDLVKFPTRHDVVYQRILVEILANLRKETTMNDMPSSSAKQSALLKAIGVPDGLENHFVGRRDVLSDVGKCFATATTKPRVFVLHGNGGMGKTQTALKYAECEIKESQFDNIIWVDARDDQRLRQSFLPTATALGFRELGSSDPARYVLAYIAQHNTQRMLLVYDNADGDEMITTIMNHVSWMDSRFRILVTTRNRRCLEFADQDTAISAFSIKEATLLMLRFLDSANTPQPYGFVLALEGICQALGGLPLAINHAALYIKITGYDPRQYLEYLLQEPRNAMRYNPKLMECSKTVWNVWESSLERISKNAYAKDIFFLISFLGSPVPHTLFASAKAFLADANRQDPDKLNALSSAIEWIYNDIEGPWSLALMQHEVRDLYSMSLVTSTGSGKSSKTSLHPLVEQWARLRSTPAEVRRYLTMAASIVHSCAETLRPAQQAHRHSASANANQRWLTPFVHSCLEVAEVHLGQSLAEIVAFDIALTFANYQLLEKKYDSASHILQIAISRLGADPRATSGRLEAEQMLSIILRLQGHHADAEAKQLAIIAELSTNDGFEAAKKVLRAKAELAVIYRDQDRLSEAREVQMKVVNTSIHLLGENSLDTLHEKACLARIYSKDQRLVQACELEEHILQVYRNEYSDRPEIMDKMRNLAITYWNLGRFESARTIEEDVLARSTDLFGEDDLETAAAMHNLAKTYQMMAKFDDAYPLLTEALVIRRRGLGEAHRSTQKTALALSEVTQKLGLDKDKRKVDSGLADME